MAAYEESVTLECIVDAYPEPKMLFWRDYVNRVPVIQGAKYDVSILPAKDVSHIIILLLSLFYHIIVSHILFELLITDWETKHVQTN